MGTWFEISRSKIVWRIEEPLKRFNYVYSDHFPENPLFNYRWRLRFACKPRYNGYIVDIYAHKRDLADTRQVLDSTRYSTFIQLLNSDGEVVKTKNYQPLSGRSRSSFTFYFNLVEATRHISTSMTVRCCVREYDYRLVVPGRINSNSSGANLNRTKTSDTLRQKVSTTALSTASPSPIGPSSNRSATTSPLLIEPSTTRSSTTSPSCIGPSTTRSSTTSPSFIGPSTTRSSTTSPSFIGPSTTRSSTTSSSPFGPYTTRSSTTSSSPFGPYTTRSSTTSSSPFGPYTTRSSTTSSSPFGPYTTRSSTTSSSPFGPYTTRSSTTSSLSFGPYTARSSTTSPSSIGPSSTCSACPISPTKSAVENNYFADLLREMWREKILTDVSFVIDETVIRCHSSVLSAASPIFRDMFLKNGVSVIDLSDCYQPEAIEDILSYVYTKECPNLSTTASQVIELSRIYHLNELEELCRKHCG